MTIILRLKKMLVIIKMTWWDTNDEFPVCVQISTYDHSFITFKLQVQ